MYHILISVFSCFSGFSILGDRGEGDTHNITFGNCKKKYQGAQDNQQTPLVARSTSPISPYSCHLYLFFTTLLSFLLLVSLFHLDLTLNLGLMPSCHYPPDSSGPGTNRKPDPDGLDMYEGGEVNIVMKDSGAKSRERRRSFPCCHTVSIQWGE